MDGSGILGKGGHFKTAAQLQSLYYSSLLLCKAQGRGGKNPKLQKSYKKPYRNGELLDTQKKTLKIRRPLIDIKHVIYAHKNQSYTEW